MNGRSIYLEEENGATKLDFWVRDGVLMKIRACILRRISGFTESVNSSYSAPLALSSH